MTLYMIRVLNYSASLKINCRFCFTYVFFFVKIEVNIDKVYKFEDVEGDKHKPYFNSCSSMTLYVIRVLDYSTSSKINCHFYSMYFFSFIEIDAEIDEVCRSENINGTKNASCLKFLFFNDTLLDQSFRLLCFIRDQLSLLFHIHLLFCCDRG
jgi:hypothetical protein